MSNNTHIKSGNGSIFIASIVIGVVMIICAFIIRSTLIHVKGFGRTITVTGAAYKPIESDYASWEGEIKVISSTIENAYLKLEQDLLKLKEFMIEQDLSEEAYEFKHVNIGRQYDRFGQPQEYILTQRFELEMGDVQRVRNLSLEASSLIEKGVELNSYNPRYIYTKLDDIKLEMIKAATENAKLRAQQLAETTGKKVGAPTSARVGVFQIRPQHSQEVSGYGISDVSSIKKEIACTVHISFLIE
jgi:uncharacterized protein